MRRNGVWRVFGGLAAAVGLAIGPIVMGTPIGGINCAWICAQPGDWLVKFIVSGCWC